VTWVVKNSAQVGAAGLKLTTAEDPSPSHTDDGFPTRMNPLKQVNTHVLPKLLPLPHVSSPLAGALSAGQVIAAQFTPSPEYPVLHAHVKDPIVSVHAAFALQLSVPTTHSSMFAQTGVCTSKLPITEVPSPRQVEVELAPESAYPVEQVNVHISPKLVPVHDT